MSVPNTASPFCDVNITYIFLLNSGPILRTAVRGPTALLIYRENETLHIYYTIKS